MDRLRKYNLISQNLVAKCDSIPFIETQYESDFSYDISVDVINTDYLNSFFKNFDTSDLYAIYILDKNEKSLKSICIKEFTHYESTIVIGKLESDFFMDVNYNNRNNLGVPFFFRTDNFSELEIENILQKCLHEKEIKIGSFKKDITTLNILKFLESAKIKSIMKFYINRSESFIESSLKLQHNTLDINAEFVSKLEININND
ncbi:hypothetical protein QWT87_11345 [Chryseobacterium sp. APV1]|uniref:Uncharacterized protein n=1 Tax=Chryseobacterium urinae TaxID=3058400 RepID=A0ABT8U350_9FLAO|nr:hypothetical protein [Chryseobacterium sp. APV1]MDO3425486.1 hypothetical protein [Chryseobacterium sp. APV1]